MSEVVLDGDWSPTVRRLAQLYRDAVKRAKKGAQLSIRRGAEEDEALAVLCAEEALAVVSLLQGLGRTKQQRGAGRSSGRYELELQVHASDAEISRNFFRLVLAEDGREHLDDVFTRDGRRRTKDAAEARRQERVEDLRDVIEAWRDHEERIKEDRLPWDKERRKSEKGRLPMPPRLRHRSSLAHMVAQLKRHLKMVGPSGKS